MEKKTIKTEAFGEIAQNEKGEYIITDAQLYNLMESKYGVENAKTVFKTVEKAKQDFAVDGFLFLGEKVKKEKTEQTLIAGTGNNRITLIVQPKTEVTIPNREPGKPPVRETRYGVCVYREQHRIPETYKADDGVLKKLADEIEKAVK